MEPCELWSGNSALQSEWTQGHRPEPIKRKGLSYYPIIHLLEVS